MVGKTTGFQDCDENGLATNNFIMPAIEPIDKDQCVDMKDHEL